QLVNLSYWSGKITYCTKPNAIIKIKRPL
ncbi:MAG: hypothetical protein JWO56_1685, partial [Acidobacteria bacterium]|nr:hypothetical protein [Acidobacteriota bacterium]